MEIKRSAGRRTIPQNTQGGSDIEQHIEQRKQNPPP
jgi:hypothetical protein